MPEPAVLLTFCAAALAVIVVPGPAVLYTVGRSVSQGRAHGLVSALGVAVGGIVHTLAAAAGISVLLARSAVAFSVVKYAGAAYLVYLGVQKLRRPSTLSATTTAVSQPLRTTFVDGIVVNVLNPKTALFSPCCPSSYGPTKAPRPCRFSSSERCSSRWRWSATRRGRWRPAR
jgi:threonine/homoserine/homoserine lactone efflux protein